MSETELKSIEGGLSKTVIIGAIGLVITFIVGLIDGYMRPLACNK